MIWVIFFILLLILMDMTTLKKARLKGRIISVYALLIISSILVGVLIALDKRPASPAEIIGGMIRFIGLGA